MSHTTDQSTNTTPDFRQTGPIYELRDVPRLLLGTAIGVFVFRCLRSVLPATFEFAAFAVAVGVALLLMKTMWPAIARSFSARISDSRIDNDG